MESSDQLKGDGTYEPTVLDVLVVRAMLNKTLSLPPELIDDVIDWAEYWPHSTVVGDYRARPKTVTGGSRRSGPESAFLVRSQPLGFPRLPAVANPQAWAEESPQSAPFRSERSREVLERQLGSPVTLIEHPCRKIVFTIRSRDQGWGGGPTNHNTYKQSWTWFDAGLERFDAGDDASAAAPTLAASELRSVWPDIKITYRDHRYTPDNVAPDPAHQVQSNCVAATRINEHRVEWSYLDDIDPESPEADRLVEIGRGRATGNGKFVRSLKLGDVVTLWAQARFAAWQNIVERVQVDVYWVV